MLAVMLASVSCDRRGCYEEVAQQEDFTLHFDALRDMKTAPIVAQRGDLLCKYTSRINLDQGLAIPMWGSPGGSSDVEGRIRLGNSRWRTPVVRLSRESASFLIKDVTVEPGQILHFAFYDIDNYFHDSMGKGQVVLKGNWPVDFVAVDDQLEGVVGSCILTTREEMNRALKESRESKPTTNTLGDGAPKVSESSTPSSDADAGQRSRYCGMSNN